MSYDAADLIIKKNLEEDQCNKIQGVMEESEFFDEIFSDISRRKIISYIHEKGGDSILRPITGDISEGKGL